MPNYPIGLGLELGLVVGLAPNVCNNLYCKLIFSQKQSLLFTLRSRNHEKQPIKPFNS